MPEITASTISMKTAKPLSNASTCSICNSPRSMRLSTDPSARTGELPAICLPPYP